MVQCALKVKWLDVTKRRHFQLVAILVKAGPFIPFLVASRMPSCVENGQGCPVQEFQGC